MNQQDEKKNKEQIKCIAVGHFSHFGQFKWCLWQIAKEFKNDFKWMKYSGYTYALKLPKKLFYRENFVNLKLYIFKIRNVFNYDRK